jgi:folate-binding protein YgfZ
MPDETPLPAASGTWRAAAAEFGRALASPVWVDLRELGVIEVSGGDAASFLHSQLTADVTHAAQGQVSPAGFCTAKGRLLATFDFWREGENVELQLPREILAPVLKRLAMFVLRAKAKLADVSDDWTTVALLGPGAGEIIRSLTGTVAPDCGSAQADGLFVTRVAGSPRVAERFVLRARGAAGGLLRERLGSIAQVGPGVWWWSQIDAGIPTVFAATQEKFVPQMINFEVLGGVNFRKGCYPGQEVVARSQYLGKLRRRMAIAHTEGEIAAGADILAEGEPQAVGTVVMAAAAPEGGFDLLFECPVQHVETGRLRAGDAEGPSIELRALPYALVDVTA